MINVNNMFTETLILCAAERISSGNISLGTNQPNGPHDQANPATYMHMNSTTTIAYHLGKSPGSPLTPNFTAMKIATRVCTKKKLQHLRVLKLIIIS